MTTVNINISGKSFSREQIRELMDAIAEATADGYVAGGRSEEDVVVVVGRDGGGPAHQWSSEKPRVAQMLEAENPANASQGWPHVVMLDNAVGLDMSVRELHDMVFPKLSGHVEGDIIIRLRGTLSAAGN